VAILENGGYKRSDTLG